MLSPSVDEARAGVCSHSVQGQRWLCHLASAIHPAKDLSCPPFALGTEVQPCPGHRLALPFSVCQSIKIQLPL